MTLPASYPLSMSRIATELGRTLPLSLLDSLVVTLAGKSGAPVSFSDLLGKTGRFDGSLPTQFIPTNDQYFVDFGSAHFFGCQLGSLVAEPNAGTIVLGFNVNGVKPQRILVTNNTTGVSVLLSALSYETAYVANLIRAGQTDNFTVLGK